MVAISIMGLFLLAAMVIGGVVLVSLIAAALGSRNGQKSSAGPILAVLLAVPVVGIAAMVMLAFLAPMATSVRHEPPVPIPQEVVYQATDLKLEDDAQVTPLGNGQWMVTEEIDGQVRTYNTPAPSTNAPPLEFTTDWATIGIFGLLPMVLGGVLLFVLIASKNRSAGSIIGGLLLVPLGVLALLGGAYLMFQQQREVASRAMAVERLREIGEQLHNAPPSPLSTGPSPLMPEEEATTSEIPVEVTTDEEPTAEASETPTTGEAEPTEDAVATEPIEDHPAEEVVEEDTAEDAPVASTPTSEAKPDWVDREEPYKEGSVYKWPLALELAVDQDEAEREFLADAVDEAIREYVQTRLSLGSRSGVVHLSGHDIAKELIVDRWAEPVYASTGDFVKLHVLLEFDRETNRQIEERWTQHIAGQRLWTAGRLLTFGLFVLTFAFAYLRFDLATKGKYRRRLRFAAATAILAFVVAGLAVLA